MCFASLFGEAQTANGNIHGQVTDPSGAVVVNATVTAKSTDGQSHSGTTNRSGAYEIGNLPPGSYSVNAVAKGFAAFSQDGVQVAPGQAAQVNIALDIAVEEQKVNVEDNSTQVDVNPSSNASAIVLSGKDLEALPDDPDELQQDLQALAGPSAGPNGGQIYIDGFTAGQLPPKSSIREIRINQNPFSAEYDKLGYGRIEIFTKPGTDKFHGQVSVMGNSSAFNSKSPFVTEDPSYYSTIYQGNIGGPLGKKASVFFDFQRRNINEVTIVNAFVPDSTNTNVVPFNESVPNPRTRTNLSPRFDYQISANNTLTARYQYFRDTQDNAGVGGFSLASTGYNETSSEHTFQVSDTQVLNSKAINETRFQYIRENNFQTPQNGGPTINVIGAFTGGGNGLGTLTDHLDRYELQNYTSLALGTHFVKFGGRLRVAHEASTAGQGYNGTFTFASIEDYLAELNNPSTATGPVQFTVTASSAGGVPTVPATVVDAGLYALDEWRVRPNITLSYGLRFETQNAIHDRGDWAPRVALAWGIGGDAKTAAKTVLRAGFGIFYDRFDESNVLNTYRQNGVIQQQYIVSNPPTPIDFFPNVPPVSQLPPTTSPTIYQIGPSLRAPYTMQSAVSVERQLTKIANLTVSYLNSEGVHQFLSWNANAPLPGGPFSTGPRPDPNAGNIYQYVSEGNFRQNQLITNFNVRAGAKLSLFGFYMLNYANSDSAGASSFPTNQYNIGVDYGRATFDIRHRVFFGGTISLPYAFRLSPFMIVNSGSPYNVTAGQDLSNDSLFNDRPALAPNPVGVCVSPSEACHYVVPTGPYTPIPVNYLEGPAHFTLNFRLAKTFGFGPETGGGGKGQQGGGPGGPPGGMVIRGGGPGGGGPGGGGGRGGGGGGMFGAATTNHRYNLTLSVNARNVLNHANLGAPIGNLTSPIFGESNSLAGGPFSSGPAVRKIELQAMFSF
jgi:hypothetical protein